MEAGGSRTGPGWFPLARSIPQADSGTMRDFQRARMCAHGLTKQSVDENLKKLSFRLHSRFSHPEVNYIKICSDTFLVRSVMR